MTIPTNDIIRYSCASLFAVDTSCYFEQQILNSQIKRLRITRFTCNFNLLIGEVLQPIKLLKRQLCQIIGKLFVYNKTWVNDHSEQQPPAFSDHRFPLQYNTSLLVYNDHLFTKATNLGSWGWSLYYGITVHQQTPLNKQASSYHQPMMMLVPTTRKYILMSLYSLRISV